MKKIVLSIAFLVIIVACGGGDDGSGPQPTPIPTPTPTANPPEAAELVFPFKDSECEEGTEVSTDQSTVTFEWKKAEHTDSYLLKVTDLKTNLTTDISSDTNAKAVRLFRGRPYSWQVISKSNSVDETAQSQSWRFYNQGEGVENYIPFPAQVVAPTQGGQVAVGNVNLEWSGADIDNDITEYDVYFGEQNPPVNLLAENVTHSIVTDVYVNQGYYYWYVITTDAVGNESKSQIFYFKVP